MAFDQTTRNRLNNFVSAARALLTEEFARQLQSDYGIDPGSGRVDDVAGIVHLNDRQRETARILRETLRHYTAGKDEQKTRIAAIDRIAREQAFTVLNRLAALRMMEARGLLITSIAEGARSDGFQLYQQLAGVALGETDDAYKAYLFSLFDEFAVDLPALFDRFSPQGRLFPGGRALRRLLELINDAEISPLWAEDETIGWIYQYFNSKEERQAMRKASQAPRNSRELAVRNQFFTPRYVVEFLTDNTLGRIWYEMTKGQTRLTEECRYLVRRPTEVFLRDPAQPLATAPEAEWVRQVALGDFSRLPDEPSFQELHELSLVIDGYHLAEEHGVTGGEDLVTWADEQIARGRETGVWPDSSLALWLILFRLQRYHGRATFVDPEMTESWRLAYKAFKASFDTSDLSQEELLRQPVYIPHRPLKEPREIKMLDPACGSMHFGLYAFDLFETIYAEAWEMGVLGAWAKVYEDKVAFMRDVPRLIIEHNIHGIDIDARAVQIAGLSLWLRAQRSWQAQGVQAADRPTITRSHVVTAEPMPGDEAELEEFLAAQFGQTTQDQIVAGLVRRVFEAMKLAGEAGVLLKIEEEIAGDIAAAIEKWTAPLQARQGSLFETLRQAALPIETTSLSDEQFWQQVAERIYLALEQFAELATREEGYRRRLFVRDASRGFAFINTCRLVYDVILMNPPFGDVTPEIRKLLTSKFPNSKIDIFAAFVEVGLDKLVDQGMLGAITSRAGFFLSRSWRWRSQVLLAKSQPFTIADLGFGVLDDAMVETSAYCLRSKITNTVVSNKSSIMESIFFRLLAETDKEAHLQTLVKASLFGQNENAQDIHVIDVTQFENLPKSPFSYWIDRSVFDIFQRFKPFESDSKTVKQGLATADDYRFVRLLWEVNYQSKLNPLKKWGSTDKSCYLKWCHAQTSIGTYWVAFAKGGEYSPYYADIHLCVNWKNDGDEIRANLNEQGNIRSNIWMLSETATSFFFRHGLTWPRRTNSNFGIRLLPSGCIFSDKGPAVLSRQEDHLGTLAALFSSPYQALIEVSLAAGDETQSGTPSRSYEVGIIQRLPWDSTFNEKLGQVTANIQQIVETRMLEAEGEETSSIYSLPKYSSISSIHDFSSANIRKIEDLSCQALENASIVERIISTQLGVSPERSEKVFGFGAFQLINQPDVVEFTDFEQQYRSSINSAIREYLETESGSRQIAVKSFYVSRPLEVLAMIHNTNPRSVARKASELGIVPDGSIEAEASTVLSIGIGCALGRWDIRFATGEQTSLPRPDPIAPLPVCPPAMLQKSDGLPAAPEDVPTDYPLRISWPGILVDDDGHPEDIVGRVREALHVIWGDKADNIEAEACALLGVDSLRHYFANPNNFFADHLSRYSKSRRAAPIYWPLTSGGGSYTLWLYYHRLHDGSLYQCVNDFVDPKLAAVQRQLSSLRGRSRGHDDERELTRLTDLAAELETFRKDLLQLAAFWRPNLNDGVEISAAPLYALFANRKWRDRLQGTWQKLQEGEYDWAHLALSIWPSRVVPKCAEDRSLAIAHDLEKLFWVEEKGTWRLLETSAEEEARQIAGRQSAERERLRDLLAKLAAGDDGYLPARQIWQSLAEGAWDYRPLGFHLFPQRAAEAAFDNATRIFPHLEAAEQKLLQKGSKQNQQELARRLLARGTPELVEAVQATLADEPTDFASLWRALERGERDERPLALELWPARVVGKALKDAKLAAQHGLFDFFWYDEPGAGVRRRQPRQREIDHEVERRGGDRL